MYIDAYRGDGALVDGARVVAAPCEAEFAHAPTPRVAQRRARGRAEVDAVARALVVHEREVAARERRVRHLEPTAARRQQNFAAIGATARRVGSVIFLIVPMGFRSDSASCSPCGYRVFAE